MSHRLLPLRRHARRNWRASPSTCLALLAAVLPVALSTRAPAQDATPVTPPAIVTLRPRASASALHEGGVVTVDVLLSKPLSQETNLLLEASAGDELPQSGLPFARLSTTQIRLAAGQTVASFELQAPEDDLRYVNPRVFVQASTFDAGVLIGNRAALAFLDNDAPRLTLRPNGSIWREGTPASAPLLSVDSNVRDAVNYRIPLITVRSSQPDVVRVPDATLGQPDLRSGAFPVQVLERSGVSAPTLVTLTASGPLGTTASANVLVVDNTSPALSLKIAPSVLDEDSRTPAQATVSRSGDTSQPLAVSLGNSNPSLVRAPTSVTIPAGSSDVTFLVKPIEAQVLDANAGQRVSGTQRSLQAIISASSGRLVSARARLDVRDTTPFVEAIATPGVLAEERAPQGNLVLRLARPRATDVTVTLQATDPRIVLAAQSVVLPRDGRKVGVRFAVRNDGIVSLPSQSTSLGLYDAPSLIRVSTGYTNPYGGFGLDSSAPVVIQEDDIPLRIRLDKSLARIANGSAEFQVTVSRQQATGSDLPVRLSAQSSFFPGRGSLSVPSVVTIPAGEASVTVAGRVAVSDTRTGGALTLQATASNFTARTYLAVESVENLGIFPPLNTETLSPSSPSGSLILRRQSFDAAATLLIQPANNSGCEAGLVAAPARVTVPAGQQFFTIPLRLLRAPRGDTFASFLVTLEGSSAQGELFSVTVRTDTPPTDNVAQPR